MIEAVSKKMQKKFGSVRALEGLNQSARGFLPTCVLSLDYVLGVPGFPLGRAVEIYGFESVGKSAVVAALVGACHQFGGFTALCDSEFSYTEDWARLFGVIPSRLLLLNPEHLQFVGEQFLYLCEALKSMSDVPQPILFALDSIAATPVMEEADEDLSGKALGLHARVLSQLFRKLTGKIADLNILFVATNQQKEKIGIYGGGGYTKIGGHTFDFHGSAQIQLKKTQIIRSGADDVVGMTLLVTCQKNKISRPYLQSSVDYYFDTGFDDSKTVILLASKWGLLTKKGGGWLEFRGQKFQSKLPSEVFEEVEKEVVTKFYGSLAEQVLQIRQLRKTQCLKLNDVFYQNVQEQNDKQNDD